MRCFTYYMAFECYVVVCLSVVTYVVTDVLKVSLSTNQAASAVVLSLICVLILKHNWKYELIVHFTFVFCLLSFIALMLLVGWQERHLAYEKYYHNSSQKVYFGVWLNLGNSRLVGQLNRVCILLLSLQFLLLWLDHVFDVFCSLCYLSCLSTNSNL